LFGEANCAPFPLERDFSLQVPDPVIGLLLYQFISAAGKLVPKGLTVALSRALWFCGTTEILWRYRDYREV